MLVTLGICGGVFAVFLLFFGYNAWVVSHDTTKLSHRRHADKAAEVAAAEKARPPGGFAVFWARLRGKKAPGAHGNPKR